MTMIVTAQKTVHLLTTQGDAGGTNHATRLNSLPHTKIIITFQHIDTHQAQYGQNCMVILFL